MANKLRILGDELTILETDDSFTGKLIKGAKKNIKIKTPFGERVIHIIKDKNGKVLNKGE